MFAIRLLLGLILACTFCAAQTISIRGVVKDTGGVGIAGAAVKLEKAGISTTTRDDGSFILTNGSTQAHRDVTASMIQGNIIRFDNSKISINVSEHVPVSITVYDIAGKQIFFEKKSNMNVRYEVQIPFQSAGIFLYRIVVGNDVYSFKTISSLDFFARDGRDFLIRSSGLSKQASDAAAIADVICVTKEGQLDYRDSIKESTVSGIVIKMIPNAGDVVDADGNVYQSVRIGNQVWTVGNLKTTKYNDGTAIQEVIDSLQWSKLKNGAYCYYANSVESKSKYGLIYNFYVVATGKLAPKGWHVPSDAEWDTLYYFLLLNKFDVAKSLSARTDWKNSSTTNSPGNDLSRNNVTGFSALPGGYRIYSKTKPVYMDQYVSSGWWSSNYNSIQESAYARGIHYERDGFYKGYWDREDGLYVRLLRN